MAHFGSLGSSNLPQEANDIRGTGVHDASHNNLGNITDVLYDHETMRVKYLVLDSSWIQGRRFLLPVGLVSVDAEHQDGFATPVTKQLVERLPEYNERSLKSDSDWKQYEKEYKQSWEESPVMHRRDAPDRVITPPEEPNRGSEDRETPAEPTPINAAALFPERIAPVFAEPGSSGAYNVTLRPHGTVRRAEEASSGVTLLKPRWDDFQDYLLEHREEIEGRCPQCAAKRPREAA